MRVRIATLTVAVTLSGWSLDAADEHFARNFRVQLVDDSIWAHCEVDIGRWGNAKVEQVSECRVEDGKLKKTTRILGGAEIEFLTKLLRDSALFEGQAWGQDRRGLDFSLLSITVDDGARVATVIASFNPSFEDGPRKVLLTSLMARARESMKATSGPTKR
jgi:hypothetical protein